MRAYAPHWSCAGPTRAPRSWCCPQYIETRYAAQLLHGSPAGVGYLLKDRVADVAEFTDAVLAVLRYLGS